MTGVPPGLEQVEPASVPAEAFAVPEPLDLTFEGWPPEAFALLERLREAPHIGQYRKEKESGALARFLKEPFKRYRDDLVVHWVLPNRLRFETEKSVFSRLLKNDFGAGGCHHHKWMAFYRPGRRRLTDVQLSHSIAPEGVDVGCYVGGYAKDLLRQARARIRERPDAFLARVNPLLEQEGWRLYFYHGSGKQRARVTCVAPLQALPDGIGKAEGLWVRRRFPRAEVIGWQSAFVRHALEAVFAVWPVYRFYLEG